MSWDFDQPTVESLSAGDLTILDGLTTISVAAWAFVRTGLVEKAHICGKSNSGDSNFFRFLREDTGFVNPAIDNIVKLFMGVDGVTVRCEGGVNGEWTLDTWHHVGASVLFNDAAGMKVYFNGAQSGLSADTTGWAGKSFRDIGDHFFIGKQRVSPTRAMHGMIAWFALWDVVLTPQEFAALARGVPPWLVRPTGLIMLAPLDGNPGDSPYYRLPKLGQVGTFTIEGTPQKAANGFPHGAPDLETDDMPELETIAAPANPWVNVSGDITAIDPATGKITSKFTNTGLTNGVCYEYRVFAKDAGGNVSPASPTVQVSPVEPPPPPPPPEPAPGEPVPQAPPMNLSQMRTMLLLYLDDERGDKYKPEVCARLLNAAKDQIAKEVDAVDAQFLASFVDHALMQSTGDSEFDLPTNFRTVLSVERLVEGGRPIPLHPVDFPKRDDLKVHPLLGVTDRYYLRDEKIGFVQPSTAYTARLHYSRLIPDLDTDDDRPTGIPSEHHHLIVLQALKFAYLAEKQDFSGWQDEYRRELDSLKTDIKVRQRQAPRYVNEPFIDH